VLIAIDNKWPLIDLARRVERALDLAEAAIVLVSDENPGIDLEALEAPPNKIIAETAMFLRAALSVPGDLAPNVVERAHTLARALVPHARHRRVEIGIALHPALALDYGAAHIVLAKAGYPDGVFDKALVGALAATTAAARERVPHRELEQDWLAALMGGPTPSEGALCRTALIKGTDLLTGSRDDVYALTHALLYATDFGNHKPLLARLDEDILARVRSALAGALDDDDFDLAGELLLAWPFLNAAWDESASLAFAVLAAVEDEVGVLPSLALDRAEYERQPVAARKSYVAAVAYHTAYVMGLLCAVMLSRNSRAAVMPTEASGSAAFSEAMLVRLATDKRRPQWLRYVEALPSSSRAGYAPLLLDVAIRRAVRQLNLGQVQQLLQIGVEHGVAHSPLCLQAADLLHRLSRLSGLN
jgi:hypothetical protein